MKRGEERQRRRGGNHIAIRRPRRRFSFLRELLIRVTVGIAYRVALLPLILKDVMNLRRKWHISVQYNGINYRRISINPSVIF